MNPKELLELVRAGYTKEEIEALEKPLQEEEEEQPAKTDEPEEPVEEKKEEAPQTDPRMDVLIKAVQDLREDLRKRSLATDDYQVSDPQKRAEEILAQIINPFENKKKN